MRRRENNMQLQKCVGLTRCTEMLRSVTNKELF